MAIKAPPGHSIDTKAAYESKGRERPSYGAVRNERPAKAEMETLGKDSGGKDERRNDLQRFGAMSMALARVHINAH